MFFFLGSGENFFLHLYLLVSIKLGWVDEIHLTKPELQNDLFVPQLLICLCCEQAILLYQ